MLSAQLDLGDNVLIAIPLIVSGITSIIASVAAVIAAYRTRELKANGGESMKDHVSKVYRTMAAAERAGDNPKAREVTENEHN